MRKIYIGELTILNVGQLPKNQTRYDVCFKCGENMEQFVACEMKCNNCGSLVDCSD